MSDLCPSIVILDIKKFADRISKKLGIEHKKFIDFLNYAYEAGEIDLVLTKRRKKCLKNTVHSGQ